MHTDSLINLLVAILIGCLTAYLAKGRGRSFPFWFFIGMFFGVFGLLALFLFRPQVANKDEVTSDKQDEIEKPKETQPIEVPVSVKTLKDQQWFYLDSQHERYGPVSFDEMESLWKDGKISSSTYVWGEGMAEWRHIKDLPLLLSFFS